jgi:hypothetical protein
LERFEKLLLRGESGPEREISSHLIIAVGVASALP